MRSAFSQMKQLETAILTTLRGHGTEALPAAARKTVQELRRDIADARLDVRDTEYAETKVEYERYAKGAKQRLERVNKSILLLSQYDLFSPIEVAEIGSRLEMLKGAI